eukprot:jgi/Mesen1/1048/ME000122S00037
MSALTLLPGPTNTLVLSSRLLSRNHSSGQSSISFKRELLPSTRPFPQLANAKTLSTTLFSIKSQQGGGSALKNRQDRQEGSSDSFMATSKKSVPVLYDFPLAYNPQKTRLGLAEKGFKYETKTVNVLSGEHLTADFLKVNPSATVPALKLEDGKFITDSTDILKYVDNLGGGPLGGDKVDRSTVDGWYDRVNAWDANLYTFSQQPAVGKFFNNFRLKVAEAELKRHPEVGESLKKRIDYFKQQGQQMQDSNVKQELDNNLQSLLDYAEQQLKQNPYAAGAAFSMADVLLMNVLTRTELNGKKDYISSRPNLAKFWAVSKERPAYKEAVAKYNGIAAVPIVVPTLFKVTLKSLFHAY